MNLSVVIICRTKDEAEGTKMSVETLRPQFLMDMSQSSSLGERKQKLVEMADREWVLILDTDEMVSPELVKEIEDVLKGKNNFIAYSIPYQNYVFGKPVYYGGEKYEKVRLFKKGYGQVKKTPLHEEIVVKGTIGDLKGVIHHYSYRSPIQLFIKFTKYAWITSRQKHEKVTIKKLFLYGPHMFWARFIKDEGWRDGWRGFVLAFAFGFMESLTYWFLL